MTFWNTKIASVKTNFLLMYAECRIWYSLQKPENLFWF